MLINNPIDENDVINLLTGLKEKAEADGYDPKIPALISLLVNNGDIVHEITEDLNEH